MEANLGAAARAPGDMMLAHTLDNQPVNPVDPSGRPQQYIGPVAGQPQDQFALGSGPSPDSNNLVQNQYGNPHVQLNNSTLVIQQQHQNHNQPQGYSYAPGSSTPQYQSSCYYQQVDANNNGGTTSSSLEFSSSTPASYYNGGAGTFGQLADFAQHNPGYQYLPAAHHHQSVYQEQPSYHSQGYTGFAQRQDGGGGQRFNGYHQPGGDAPPEGAHPVKGPPGACCVADPATGGPAGAGGLPTHNSTHHFRCVHQAPEQQRQRQQQQLQQQPQHQAPPSAPNQPRQQLHQSEQLRSAPEMVGGRRAAARHPAVVAAAPRTAGGGPQQQLVARSQVMARRKNATRETTSLLRKWLGDNTRNPYPSKSEKMMLSMVTKMSLTQVSTWFANARRRMKKENKMLAWALQRPGGRPGEQSGSQAAGGDPRRSSWYFRSLVELAASRSRANEVSRQRRPAPRRTQVSCETAEAADSESAAESPSTTSQLGAEEPAISSAAPKQ